MTTVTREDDRAVVRPSGDSVVAANLPELRNTMRDLVVEGVREVVIDLAGVCMVDSTGIGLLISAHNSLHQVGGHLAVINASEDLLQLFQTMRMHQHFSVSGALGAAR